MTGRQRHCLRTTVCALLLVAASGCSQRWTFAPPGSLRRVDAASVEQPPSTTPRAARRPAVENTPAVAAAGRVVATSHERPPTPPAQASFFASLDAPSQDIVRAAGVEPLPPVVAPGSTFFTEAPRKEPFKETDWAWVPGPVASGYGVFRRAECDFVAATDCVYPRLPEGLTRLRWKVLRDYRNFYRWPASRDLLLGIAGASLLANTSMDQDFRDWVQDDVRSHSSDEFADVWKPLGEGQYMVPGLVGVGLAGWLLEDWPVGDVAGHYGWRASRAYLVGTPPAVFLQWALGGSRPGEKWYESSWRLFADKNAVSGHAFIGAVPLITAAQMCENRYAAGCFYFMSLLPAWSRINDDSHYLSQSVLGWWIAYLACRSVDETDAQCEGRRFTVVPLCGPGTAGVSAMYAF